MKCKAKAKSTGKPCRRDAIAGGTVCQVHGGAAPQVKRKAAERLRALVHPAIDRLEKTIEDECHPQTALAAARDVLDRVPETSRHSKLAVGAAVDIGDPGREKLTDEKLAQLVAAAKQVVNTKDDSS